MASIAVDEGRSPLLARGADGELERLYAKHAAEVRRYVQLVLRNRNDVEDIVQQTYLKALRALQQGVRPEKPRQWLVAIAHNECRMLFRQASRRPLEVGFESAGELGSRATDDGVSAEAIREALGHLAPNQRSALVMRELDDRSYAEIAQTLDVTEAAVETLLFRARRALREQLESAGDCDEAQGLIATDSLDDLARRRLRAHTRTCRACATLERRRRGKLAAASRKLAGLFPTPSWLPSLFGGGGIKAVAAIAAAAVAATGAAEAAKTVATRVGAQPGAERLVHRNGSAGAVVTPAIASSLTQLAPAKAQVAGATAELVRHAAAAAKAAAPSLQTDAKRGEASPAAQDRPLAVDANDAAPGVPAATSRSGARPAPTTTVAPPEPADGTRAGRPGPQSGPLPVSTLKPTSIVPTVTVPDLPPLPQVEPPAPPAASPLPAVPPLPSVPSPADPPSTSQLPPLPAAPPAPPLPPVQAPAVPTVQTPTVPSLTKP
jgi:RNA polymerase sigma factor (sigma-70 family)